MPSATARGRTYPVVEASEDGQRHSLNRSLLKHAPETAIRDAAEFRFHVRRGLPGFEYASADALFLGALAAYRAYVAGAPSA